MNEDTVDVQADTVPPSRVPLPDAPCDYPTCMAPWVRRIQGRYTCAEHTRFWKEIPLPPHPHDS